MNEESYHRTLNTVRRLIYRDLKDSDIILINKESLVSNYPTIFLASHVSRSDIVPYCVALNRRYEEIGEKAVVRPVIADELFLLETITEPRKKLFWKGVNRLIINVVESSGGIIMKRGYSLDKTPRKLAPSLYLEALAQGDKLLIYPLAVFSKDGSVDYDGKQLQFTSKHIAGMARHIEGLHVQYVHLTYEPVGRKCVVTLGSSRSGDELQTREFNFREEIASCTTITPLQLTVSYLAALYEYGSTPYVKISPQELESDLELLLADVEKQGFRVFDESSDTREVVSFLKRKRLLAVEGENFFLHNSGVHNNFYNFQRNNIKHLDLEGTIRQFAERGRTIR